MSHELPACLHLMRAALLSSSSCTFSWGGFWEGLIAGVSQAELHSVLLLCTVAVADQPARQAGGRCRAVPDLCEASRLLAVWGKERGRQGEREAERARQHCCRSGSAGNLKGCGTANAKHKLLRIIPLLLLFLSVADKCRYMQTFCYLFQEADLILHFWV